MRRFAAIILACLALCATLGAQNALPPVKWRTLAEGDQSSAIQFERHFMNSEGDIQTYLTKMKPSPMRSSLKVDWNKELVIAVHMGQRNTGGFKVYVETIDRTTAAAACVRYVELHPAPRSPVSQAKSSPWVMIAVERPGNVEWQFTSRALQGIHLQGKCRCFCNPCGCRQSFYGNPNMNLPWRNNTNANFKPMGAVGYQEYDWGRKSNIRSLRTFSIRSEESFFEYWRTAFGERNLPRKSGIDWRYDMLVAIHIGEVNQGQYPLIDSVNRNWNQTMDVFYSVNVPRPYRGQSLKDSPFVSIIVPNYGDIVSFKGYTQYFDPSGGCSCGCACGKR